jgi:DNA-binding NarL/FixJ family response regulator
MNSGAVGVLIVDDQAPFRRAAKMVLAATPGFDVIGEAESGEEAVELFDSLAPGLVLMDINLPGINGIEATRRITEAHPDATVLLLSTYQAADLPSGADSCGAAGYVNKEEFAPAVVVDLWNKRQDPEPQNPELAWRLQAVHPRGSRQTTVPIFVPTVAQNGA